MNNIRSPAASAAIKNNVFMNAANTFMNSGKNISKTSTGLDMTHYILIGLFVVVIILFAMYWKSINNTLYMIYEHVRQLFGAKQVPIEKPKDEDKSINVAGEAPQDKVISSKKLVEKILPGGQQVFNISKNSYTYYDAEPLCKALGAELATYEQVKKAYSHGADWCNYGWVKGQMAVYPTQKSTWDTLQSGPEKDRLSCGRPGLNGGYFDNPELRFGVNCYGNKPDQKDHDATAVASGEGAPLSPGELEQEKKIAKYRGETNYISVLPFNKTAWSN
jgi:hypothetical protein